MFRHYFAISIEKNVSTVSLDVSILMSDTILPQDSKREVDLKE